MPAVLAILCLILLSACPGAAADHERRGDRAYREERYGDALAEYLSAQRSNAKGRVWAKAGAAAMKANKLAAAVDAYRALAADDPTRVVEAATGLERVARLAERGGAAEAPNLARAIVSLRTIAPRRPLGRLALSPAASSDALGLLPSALASARSGRATDSLLLVYADAQRETTACEAAARSYRVLIRRTTDAQFRTAGREGLAVCALRLGLDALAAEQGEAAERWFDATLSVETGTPRAFQAQVGRGDARLQQGDVLGAAIAYQAVLSSPAVPDSLRQIATNKLNRLGAAPAPPGPGAGG